MTLPASYLESNECSDLPSRFEDIMRRGVGEENDTPDICNFVAQPTPKGGFFDQTTKDLVGIVVNGQADFDTVFDGESKKLQHWTKALKQVQEETKPFLQDLCGQWSYLISRIEEAHQRKASLQASPDAVHADSTSSSHLARRDRRNGKELGPIATDAANVTAVSHERKSEQGPPTTGFDPSSSSPSRRNAPPGGSAGGNSCDTVSANFTIT